MNLIYNSNADTFHIRFVDEPAAKQDDVGHGLVLHRDASGGIIEIELRDARQRLSKEVELPGPSPFS